MRSKEVEEAIEKTKRIRTGLMNFNELLDNNNVVINGIDKVLNYIEELEQRDKVVLVCFDKEGNLIEYINKQAIRDKIKELEEKLKYIGGCDNNCKKCFNSERKNSFEYCFAYHQIKILKSIIGE